MQPHRSLVVSLLVSVLAPAALTQTLPVTTTSEEARRHFELGRTAAHHYQFAEAREHLDAAIAADPSFVLAHLHRGGSADDPRELQDYLSRAEANRDRATEGERRMIDAFHAFLIEHDYNRAVEIFSALSEEYPDDPYLAAYLGLRYYRNLRRYDEAAEQFRRALARDARFVQAYNWLGHIAMDQGDYATAEETFKRYVRLAPDEPRPYNSLGVLYLRQGRYEEAEALFEQALAIDTRFTESQGNLARARIGAKTAAWADAMVDGVVPDLIPDLFTQDAVRLGAGRQQRGREAILEHARTFPRYAAAAFNLDDLVVVGDVAYGTGRYTVRTMDGEAGEGTYLKVWRREADGEWRIDRIMFQ